MTRLRAAIRRIPAISTRGRMACLRRRTRQTSNTQSPRRTSIPATGTTLASNIGTAIVNTVPLDGVSGHPPAVPWPFTSTSSGTASQYVQVGEFFEAGVDLNLLFPNLTNFNFGTFMVETRSSTSTNATLSDFILGHVSTAP